MNIFITTGTYDFLKRIETKHPEEVLITMVNQNGALLLHETSNKTIFKEPRRYEVLEANGELKKEGLVVMNNIPVTGEGRPIFEHQLKYQTKNLGHVPGFIADRALRPLSSNTYIILTVWENDASYQKWQNSESFFSAHQNTNTGADLQPKIFESASYVSKYTITE